MDALLDSDCLKSLTDWKWDRGVDKGISSLKLILTFKGNAHINTAAWKHKLGMHRQKYR